MYFVSHFRLVIPYAVLYSFYRGSIISRVESGIPSEQISRADMAIISTSQCIYILQNFNFEELFYIEAKTPDTIKRESHRISFSCEFLIYRRVYTAIILLDLYRLFLLLPSFHFAEQPAKIDDIISGFLRRFVKVWIIVDEHSRVI